MINDDLYRRHHVVQAIAIIVVVVFIVRLFGLQVIDKSYRDKSENISLVNHIPAPRIDL